MHPKKSVTRRLRALAVVLFAGTPIGCVIPTSDDAPPEQPAGATEPGVCFFVEHDSESCDREVSIHANCNTYPNVVCRSESLSDTDYYSACTFYGVTTATHGATCAQFWPDYFNRVLPSISRSSNASRTGCGRLEGTSACDTQFTDTCCDAASTCMGKPECAALFDCLKACASTDGDCMESCEQQHGGSSGNADSYLEELMSCVYPLGGCIPPVKRL